MKFSFPFALALFQVGFYAWFFKENDSHRTSLHSILPLAGLKPDSHDGSNTVSSKYYFLTSSCDAYPNPFSCFAVVKPIDCLANCFMAFTVVPFVINMIGLPSTTVLYALSGTMSSFAFIFSSQFQASLLKRSNKELGEIEKHTVNKSLNSKDSGISSSPFAKKNSLSVGGSDTQYACSSNGAFSGLATVSLLFGSELSNRAISQRKLLFIKLYSASYLIKSLYEEYIVRNKMKECTLWSGSSSAVSSLSEKLPFNSGIIGGIFYGFIHHVLFSRTKFDMTLKKNFYTNLVQGKWS